MSHTQKKHKVDRSFFIIAGCGASWATAAVSKQHYKEAHDHDAGERQAPERRRKSWKGRRITTAWLTK